MKIFYEQRGLRFPDDNIIRFFFKEQLDKMPGTVLELGCGNGNNLTLFNGYGWNTCGIDISESAIQDARFNFEKDQRAEWIVADLSKGLPKQGLNSKYDVILLPNINYYIPRAAFENILTECSALLAPGGYFFIRARTPADWRYGKGKQIEPNGFLLSIKETGEEGLLNVFYEAGELQRLIVNSIGKLKNEKILKTQFDNFQMGKTIKNDDITLWGQI